MFCFVLSVMEKPMDQSEQIREWLKKVMDKKALSGNAWAQLAKVAPSTVTRALNPDHPFTMSLTTINKLAAVVNDRPPIGVDKTKPFKVSGAPIRGKVAAGMFQENWDAAFDIDPRELEHVPVAIAGFPDGLLYALELDGPSMNKAFPNPSTYVIVCPYGQTPVGDGDFVIAERRDGAKVEATCKRLKLTGRGWELWPDSFDPTHQEPISLSGDEVKITGVVVGSWSPRARPGVMFNQ
jgi:SOS-response transcriptional repressor LexA